MDPGPFDPSRRAFGALAMAMVPVAGRAEIQEDAAARFAADVARSYELQRVAVDMEDVMGVFRAVRNPALGVAVATGAERAALAARDALRAAGGLGEHTLAVLAFPPNDWRLREYATAMRFLLDQRPADATVIFGVCDDPALAAGSVRVSILTE